MRKSCLPVFLLLFAAGMLRAVDAGGRIAIRDLRDRSVPVLSRSAAAEREYEVIVFLNMESPDTSGQLRMLNDLESRFREETGNGTAKIFVLAGNARSRILDDTDGMSIRYDIHSDERRLLFREYLPDDVLFPVALIAKSGKVLWKGSPIDIPNILDLMKKGKFDPDIQVKVGQLRKELQMGIQASLPDVILRCADEILKLQPGDAIAVRAKLFVLENMERFPDALAFTRKNAADNPDDVNQTLLYFDYLVRQGDPDMFSEAFRSAVKQFERSPESSFRLLGFYLQAVPFGWVHPREVLPIVDRLRSAAGKMQEDRRAQFLICAARVSCLLCRPDDAVKDQEEAVRLLPEKSAAGREARRMLEYYRALQAGK